MCGGERGDSVPPKTKSLTHYYYYYYFTQIDRIQASTHQDLSIHPRNRTRRQIDRWIDRSIQEKNMHLEVGAQVVGPPLPALLAHAAGEGLRYHRPLPVAVLHHHLPQDSASSERASTDRAGEAAAQSKFSINTFLHRIEPKRSQIGRSDQGALTRPRPQSRGPCAGAPCSRRPLAGAAAAASAEPRSRRRAERWT